MIKKFGFQKIGEDFQLKGLRASLYTTAIKGLLIPTFD